MGESDKKAKVLHARIPESLDREIKRRARSLGMSASTVVRNVLLHTFDLVEDIVTDGTNLAMALTGQEPRPPDASAPDSTILGWQELVLNLNAVCDRCNAILEKGCPAALGIRDTPGTRTIICPACFEQARAKA